MGADLASRRLDGGTSRALARSQLYRLLALAFRYPDGETASALARLAPAVGLAALADPPPGLGRALADLAAAAREETPEALRDRYVGTFGHVTLPDCPLHETFCGAADPFQQAQVLADLAGFYRAFGLEIAPGAGERADHLAVELEFMHYLAYREAYALEHHGPERAATIRDAQRRFLAEHLGRWGPVVARAVAARAEGLLGPAAHLLEAFLDDELKGWDISPPPLVVGAASMFAPTQGDACPAEGDDAP